MISPALFPCSISLVVAKLGVWFATAPDGQGFLLVNPETGRARGISPHRLRDAFAVHAVKTDDSGDGLRLLQEHLGHVSFNTADRYRKVSGRKVMVGPPGWTNAELCRPDLVTRERELLAGVRRWSGPWLQPRPHALPAAEQGFSPAAARISGTSSSLPMAMMWTPSHSASLWRVAIIRPAISIPFLTASPLGA